MAEQPRKGGAPGWGQAVFWPAGARWLGIVWASVIAGTYVGAIEIYPWLGEVSLLWLPNAVLVIALLRFRPRDWPFVYAAGIAAEGVGESLIGMGLNRFVPLGMVNAIEATLLVFVAARIAGGRNKIGLLSVRGALAVLIGSITVPVLTGAFGAAILKSRPSLKMEPSV